MAKRGRLKKAMTVPIPRLQGMCTTCQKKWWLSEVDQQEAREMGVAFSHCCHAVATIAKVEVKS